IGGTLAYRRYRHRRLLRTLTPTAKPPLRLVQPDDRPPPPTRPRLRRALRVPALLGSTAMATAGLFALAATVPRPNDQVDLGAPAVRDPVVTHSISPTSTSDPEVAPRNHQEHTTRSSQPTSTEQDRSTNSTPTT